MMKGMEQIEEPLHEFLDAAMALYKDKITDVILYGSYARGDYDEHSDIDIMILMDIAPEEEWRIREKLFDIAIDLEFEYGKCISPVVTSKKLFSYWENDHPFYINVKNEGVKLA